MLTLIFKSYFFTFLSVGVGSLFLLIAGLFWIFSSSTPSLQDEADVSTIAGDDVISTQLDLARAYIETNNKKIAKKILRLVVSQGNKIQKEEARALLGLI